MMPLSSLRSAFEKQKFSISNLTRIFNIPSKRDMEVFWDYASRPDPMYAFAIESFLEKVGGKYADKKSPDGKTALMIAEESGNTAAVRVLQKYSSPKP